MSTIDATNLAEMTITALERTAMVLAESADDGDEAPEPERFAWIAYRGPSNGRLLLSANDGFLSELAASMLGCEAGDVDAATHGAEALKELTNILGGSVIRALSGEQCDYSLGLPDTGTSSVRMRADAACAVAAEGGVLRVAWCDDGPPGS